MRGDLLLAPVTVGVMPPNTGVECADQTRERQLMAPKVLIVEDNDATRTGLSELLKRAGYETHATRSFEEGLRAMREDTPDLLIADVRLGPYNGLQLLVTSPKRVPTIVMTGFPDPVLEADAHHLGAQFILKPVAPAALLALVEEQLAARPAQELSGPTRRWARKQVAGELTAQVEDVPARIIDVSYGGMRFQLAREAERQLPCKSISSGRVGAATARGSAARPSRRPIKRPRGPGAAWSTPWTDRLSHPLRRAEPRLASSSHPRTSIIVPRRSSR